MANDFFNAASVPATSASLTSATIRGEFAAIAAGFDKMPSLTSVGNRVVHVNAGSTALTVTSGFTFDGTTFVAPALTVTNNATVTGDLAVNGGDLTSTAATFNLLAVPTTLNIGAAATTIALGAATGTLTLGPALVGSIATDATSATTGAFKTAGGLGVAKALWVGGLANIAGAVTLQSTLTFSTAASQIVPGATSLALRNTANNANNILISDAGGVTLRGNFVMAATTRIFPDGGGDSYIEESAANTLNFVTGGSAVLTLSHASGSTINSAAGGAVLGLTNSHASGPRGQAIYFSAVAPNNGSDYFLYQYDTVGLKAAIYSNGGLSNYSANNVNLSDLNAKVGFKKYEDAELDALEDKFLQLDYGKFKYRDQTHNDWNYGRSAQSVKAAIPELSGIWNPTKRVIDDAGNTVDVPTPESEQLIGEYAHDIGQISEAIVQRLIRRVRALEAR